MIALFQYQTFFPFQGYGDVTDSTVIQGLEGNPTPIALTNSGIYRHHRLREVSIIVAHHSLGRNLIRTFRMVSVRMTSCIISKGAICKIANELESVSPFLLANVQYFHRR